MAVHLRDMISISQGAEVYSDDKRKILNFQNLLTTGKIVVSLKVSTKLNFTGLQSRITAINGRHSELNQQFLV